MEDKVTLRILGYLSGNTYRLICLDTYIAVEADSLDNAKTKMLHALISYFKTFSHEELLHGKFKRKAPLQYFIKYYFAKIIRVIRNFPLNSIRLRVKYDINTENLRFA